VTAPLQTDPRRNNISQQEVVSRLQALANTIDSRGWAVKNVPVNLYSANNMSASDRLVAGSALGMSMPGPGTFDSTDIFDEAANPLAGQLEAKMAAAATNKRQQLQTAMVEQAGDAQAQTQPAAPAQTWYTPQQQPTFTTVPTAGNPTAEEEALIARSLGNQPAETVSAMQPAAPAEQGTQTLYSSIRTPQPPAAPVPVTQQAAQAAPAPSDPVTPQVNPAIIELANNNDLNIDTIAREAKQIRATHPDGTLNTLGNSQAGQDGEVSISLR
jgi:hypothetical protein